jgi:hypothetical protein
MTTQTITVSSEDLYPTLIEASPNQPILIFNTSDNINVYASEDSSFSILSVTSSIIVRPLGYIIMIVPMYFATQGVPNVEVQALPAIGVGPSPIDVAASLILAGLATSANQTTAIANQQTNISTIEQGNAALGAINGNHVALHSMIGNSFFTDPNGNADLAGWVTRNGTAQTAGVNGSTSLPTGVSQNNGFFFTANGTAPGQIQVGGANTALVPVTPGAQVVSHWWVNPQSLASPAFVGHAYFNAAGTFISTLMVNTTLVGNANVWTKIYGTTVAPANAAWVDFVYGLSTPVNGATFYGAACIGYVSGVPGTLANDHAQAISTTGSPLLHGYNALENPGTSSPLAAGASSSFTFSVKKPGYVIEFNVGFGAALNPLIQVTMSWQDDATNIEIAREVWYMNGNTTNNCQTYGKGPTKANQLVVTLKNMDTVAAATVTWGLSETTQHIQRDDWRTGPLGTINTSQPAGLFVNSTNDPFALMLGWVVHAYGIAETDYYLMPLYSGQCNINVVQTVSQVFTVRIYAWDPTINAADFRNCPIISSQTVAALTAGPFVVNLPRCPCILQVTSGPAAVTINVSLTNIEYAS